MTQRVVVAYDESEQARAALHHTLTTHAGAEIHVLHVNDPREWMGTDDMGGLYSEKALNQMQASATQLLDEARSIAKEHDVDITVSTANGRIASEIVQYVEENDVDHIVLGSHGRRGLARFLLGSVAERVVRRSPVSVTVIRKSDR